MLITRPTFIDRAEERFWSKCARPSLIPPVPPAFVSQLGSWGHASASILIITISILPTSSHAWDPTMPFAIFLGYCLSMPADGQCPVRPPKWDICFPHWPKPLILQLKCSFPCLFIIFCYIFGCLLISILKNRLFISNVADECAAQWFVWSIEEDAFKQRKEKNEYCTCRQKTYLSSAE